MAYIPSSGSVVGFQSDPTKLLVTASVAGAVSITNLPATQNVSGSVLSFQAGTNITSISGTVTNTIASIATAGGTLPVSGSVMALQGTNPWIITGSVQATAAANQSVSGTVNIAGNPSISGTVQVGNFPTTQNVSGSVVATQGTNPWIITGSVQATAVANQSVSGAVTAPPGSIMSISTGTNTGGADGNSSNQTMGLSQGGAAGGLLVYPAVFNGTNWDRARGNSSVGAMVHVGAGSVITVHQGSVGAVITGGSVVAVQGTSPWIITGSVQATAAANQSVSGTVNIAGNPSISGTVQVGNFPTTQNVSGSVVATQGTNPWIITGSVQGSFSPSGNQSVSGTVGASIIGQLPAGTAVLGSIMALQGTNPWIITGSVQATAAANQSVSGTVNIAGNPSISGAVITGTAFTNSDSSAANAWQFGVGTTGNAATYPLLFNGTNYDRLRGNSSVGAMVHVGAGSVITVTQGSIAAFIIGGSVATATTNSSVMLLNGANTIGSVTALQGTNPWIITGSVQATAVANQSVSGTVGASIIGSPPVNVAYIGGSSVATASTASLGIQKVGVVDSFGQNVSAFPATYLRTTDEPHQLFYDAFDSGTVDTTNRWTSSSGGSAAAASIASGVMVLGTSSVANSFSKLVSQASFPLPIPGWLGASDAIALPDGAAPTANAYRYWGTGTTPVVPSIGATVTDGVGFELNTDSKLRAVVFAGGVKTVIQDLSSSGNNTQPLDAANHRYIVVNRTDKAYWYIDGVTATNLVATSNFQAPQVQALPRLFLGVAGATPPATNTQIQVTGATSWDTAKNNMQISDGILPYRKATVKSSVTAAVTTDTALVTALHPSTPLPAGTNALGAVFASITGNVSVSGTVNIAGNPSISGTVNIAGNPSISGTVAVTQQGAWTQSVVGTVGASIIGQLPAGTAVLGSVAALQGTNPWTVTSSIAGGIFPISGSVAATITNTTINVSGSVVAAQIGTRISSISGGQASVFQGGAWTVSVMGGASVFQAGTWNVSVAGTYATNAASVISGLGILMQGVRNDTMGSVLATADGTYGPFAVGTWGDHIVSMAPSAKWVSGIASCFTGVEQPLITSVLGTRVNVTGIQVANASANNVYLSFYGAGIGSVTGSIIGYTVVPANGGSNITFPVPLQTAINSGFSASVSGVASVFLSAQGFLSKV